MKKHVIEEFKKKLAYFEEIESKNKSEIKSLLEQSQNDQYEIDKLKEDIETLVLKVWKGRGTFQKTHVYNRKCSRGLRK